MTHENFCYWLQGFFELKKTIDHREGITPDTVKVIEDHLNLVFNKITPNRTCNPVNKFPSLGIDPNFAIDPSKWKITDSQPGITLATC